MKRNSQFADGFILGLSTGLIMAQMTIAAQIAEENAPLKLKIEQLGLRLFVAEEKLKLYEKQETGVMKTTNETDKLLMTAFNRDVQADMERKTPEEMEKLADVAKRFTGGLVDVSKKP